MFIKQNISVNTLHLALKRTVPFVSSFSQIGRLLNPIARGLKTLEEQQVTCSDVFFIYIGLAVAFQQAFSDPCKLF
jgi:hypothetical protein